MNDKFVFLSKFCVNFQKVTLATGVPLQEMFDCGHTHCWPAAALVPVNYCLAPATQLRDCFKISFVTIVINILMVLLLLLVIDIIMSND